MSNVVAGVIGTDGVSPIYDQEADWKIWNVHRVWKGPEFPGADASGAALSVPKIEDYIIDPQTTEVWICDYLDPETLTPTLRFMFFMNGEGGDGHESWMQLFGVGVSQQLLTYRAYLNTKVTPHTMALDTRWMPRGSTTSYVQVFKGVNTNAETGEIISKIFDSTGTLIGTKVPLELAGIDSHDNRAFKLTKRFNVNEAFPNDEVITAVAFSDDGHVVDRMRFLVENTNLIADVSGSTKYITDISIKSVWLSQSDSRVLEYPLGNTLDAINLTGVVHYSDGSTLELPVDGSKFAMLGLTKPSSIPYEGVPLILRYQLGAGELAASPNGAANGYIRQSYRLKTINPNHAMEVKLFGYPVWSGTGSGWVLRFFLLNTARNLWFDVTPHVRFTETKGAYDPTLYGYVQKKQVSVNLRDVSQAFIPYIHTQEIDITLNHPPENKVVPDWTVFTQGGSGSRYGVGVYGRIDGNQVNFQGDASAQEDWIDANYRRTDPLVNEEVELHAPTPTHFEITNGTSVTTWTIDHWNQNIAIGGVLQANRQVVVRFTRQSSQGELTLSMGMLTLKTLS